MLAKILDCNNNYIGAPKK